MIILPPKNTKLNANLALFNNHPAALEQKSSEKKVQDYQALKLC